MTLAQFIWIGACLALVAGLAFLPIIMRRRQQSKLMNERGAEDKRNFAPLTPPPVSDLPREKEPPADVASGPDLAETWKLSRDAVYRALILVVEDNRVIQLVTRGYLEQLGHRVDLVSNGEEAVEAVSNLQYDLILMDLAMPVLDGYEAAAKIREIEKTTGRHVPIIAFTAHTREGDKEKCLQVGMDEYLRKPLGKDELGQVIERWLRRRPPHGGLAPSPSPKNPAPNT